MERTAAERGSSALHGLYGTAGAPECRIESAAVGAMTKMSGGRGADDDEDLTWAYFLTFAHEHAHDHGG